MIHAIILLIQKFRDKDGVDVRLKNDNPDAYFSGSTGHCGYANASKFSEVFKKNEGVLPKDWRK